MIAFDVPRVESLFELESLCQPGKPDAEFWQMIAIGACREIAPLHVTLIDFDTQWDKAVATLGRCKYHYRDLLSSQKEKQFQPWEDAVDLAEQTVTGEINFYIHRLLGNPDGYHEIQTETEDGRTDHADADGTGQSPAAIAAEG